MELEPKLKWKLLRDTTRAMCERERGRARVKERPTGAVIRVLSVEKFGIRLLFITRAACREQNAPRAAKEVKVASRLQLCSMPQCVMVYAVVCAVCTIAPIWRGVNL